MFIKHLRSVDDDRHAIMVRQLPEDSIGIFKLFYLTTFGEAFQLGFYLDALRSQAKNIV